jgi:anti-anti-sigma factor
MTQTAHMSTHRRVAGARRPDVVIVLDDRTLPAGLTHLRSVVRDAFLEGGGRVVVDVAGLQRLSSGTVAALLWANRHCAQRGGVVVLRAPSESNLDLLRRTGLGDVLRVDTLELSEHGRR